MRVGSGILKYWVVGPSSSRTYVPYHALVHSLSIKSILVEQDNLQDLGTQKINGIEARCLVFFFRTFSPQSGTGRLGFGYQGS